MNLLHYFSDMLNFDRVEGKVFASYIIIVSTRLSHHVDKMNIILRFVLDLIIPFELATIVIMNTCCVIALLELRFSRGAEKRIIPAIQSRGNQCITRKERSKGRQACTNDSKAVLDHSSDKIIVCAN